MLTAGWARRHQYQLKILTGKDLGVFLHLAARIDAALLCNADTNRPAPRLRARGGGRRGILHNAEVRALLVLIHVRHYPTQEILAILMGVSQETICERLHPLLDALQAALGTEIVMPKRPSGSGDWIIPYVQGKSYVIDGFDRPIQRPIDHDHQKMHYSGKKKRHTIKNTAVIDKVTGLVVALGATYPGSIHDKKIAEYDGMRFLEGSTHDQDTGYQGFLPFGSIARQPKKKPKGRELSEWDKFENRIISMERVLVEHAIRGIKIHRAAKEVVRNHKAGYRDQIVAVAAGLYNLTIAA